MSDGIPHIVDIDKTTNCGLCNSSQIVFGSSMLAATTQYAEIGARLRAVRRGFSDLNQGSWAEKHGFGVTQYNNWEKGVRRIPVDDAERLCNAYGLTLDFIYRGRRDGLSETASKSL